MRKTVLEQLPLVIPPHAHEHVAEVAAMGAILDAHAEMADWIWADLVRGLACPETGREGLAADVVLRALVLKQMRDFSYAQLSFALADSATYRSFCRIGLGEPGPSRSSLADAIKKVRATTLEKVCFALVAFAEREGIEKGRTVRFDCTVVCTDIHPPNDSSLLWDAVRVLVRWMKRLAEEGLWTEPFRDRRRVAKRRALAIQHAPTTKKRRRLYRDLLTHTEAVLAAARRCLGALHEDPEPSLLKAAAIEELERLLPLVDKVILQTMERVFEEQKVPAQDKVVSLFEEHTDVIVKDRRATLFGHKVALCTGRSGLILDAQILRGNPADSTLPVELVERQRDLYDRVPRQVSFDGAFASKANLAALKEHGVQDVAFAKKRGLKVQDMAKSEWVYRRLRDFRAGIEAGISWLKRSFGLARCTWKGFDSFRSYVWGSILAANLLTLARAQMR